MPVSNEEVHKRTNMEKRATWAILVSIGIKQPISTNCFSVKDSFSFAEWAKQYTHNGEFMCSFDVSLLFTNVPLDETIEICLDELYALANPPSLQSLPRLVLKNLLLFATKKSHFVFKWAIL